MVVDGFLEGIGFGEPDGIEDGAHDVVVKGCIDGTKVVTPEGIKLGAL